ncbi:hypothetical protein [Mangrovihabitans endophyticus]|uniref:Extracellular repeat, HAF family n=1 Tax=Mangrovihabitans endophyticus TaxID=1751298 RepID=A0A8J3FS87_9ACTN|nr:hypothetical protein [Mangrovihabitans endophyticus]GGL13114.1 hypothetical protein GCM10012284_54700 [Mangrovihabitans endophyticus]
MTFVLIAALASPALASPALATPVLASPALATSAQAAERQYLAVDLGALGDGVTTAAALNETGSVVGTSAGHAFLWRDGSMRDLGTLPGGHSSAARDINELDQIAGSSTDAAGRTHAVLWRQGTIVDLGLGVAYGVNDLGEVVLERPVGAGKHRFVWRRGALTDRGVTPSLSKYWETTIGINNRGEIIGNFVAPPGDPCQCASAGGIQSRSGEVTLFGGLKTPSSYEPVSPPFGFNNHGDVVGESDSNGRNESRPYRWHDGTLTELPILGGYEGIAMGVNDDGVAVGMAQNDQLHPPFTEPVTWVGTEINSLYDQGVDADVQIVDLNNRGEIIANSILTGAAYLYR